MDLSTLSDADLEALSKNDLTRVSDEGLNVLHAQSLPKEEERPWYDVSAKGTSQAFKNWLPSLPTKEQFSHALDLSPEGAYQGAKNALPMAGMIAGAALSGGANIPIQIAAAGLGSAAGKGVENVADEAQGQGPKSRSDLYGGILQAGAEGAGAEAGGLSVAPAAKALASGVGKMAPEVSSYLAQKFGKVFANIPENFTKEYLDRDGNINARPSEQIMDELSDHYNSSQDALANAKSGLEDAKETAGDTKSNLSNDLADQRFQTRDQLGDAKSNLDDAYQGVKEKLSSSNIQNLKEPISDSISKLQEQVSQGSSAAFKILDKAKGTVEIQPVLHTLDSEIKDLTINGQAISDTASNSVKNLTALGERLANLGTDITFPQAKQVIQQLDSDISFSSNAGSYAPEADKVKSVIRKQLDEILKADSPAYKAQMQVVAEKTNLLSQLSQGFGTDTKIINRLEQIGSEKGVQVDLPLINQLAQHTGQDFNTPIQQHLAQMDTLNSPSKMQAIKESLPEYKTHQDLLAQHNTLSDPATRRGIADAPDMMTANDALARRQTEFDQAQDRAKSLQALNPATVQNKVKSLTGLRSYGAENTFADVDKVTGKEYGKEIKDRAILDSFNKTDTQGSRKTLLGGAVGTGVGALIGHPFLGAQIGALAGTAADKYAGQAFKAALDTGIGISKFSKQLGPFAKTLTDAASRGPQAIAATHYLLQQNNEDYRKRINEINGTEK